MSLQAFPGRVREFFTMHEAELAARALPEDARTAVQHELDLASQRREAAETLWPRGSAAEALRLVSTSFDAMSAALDGLASRVEERPPWLARALTLVADARRQTADLKLPELEADVQRSHEAQFQALVDALIGIEEAVRPRVVTAEQTAVVRRQRWVISSMLGAVALVGLVIALRTPPFSRAVASAALGEHVAAHAIDGDTKTWWVLPSTDPGWIDLTLGKARAVPVLRIVAGNTPWNDHVTKDALVEAFLGDKMVKAMPVTFRLPPPTQEPDWTEVKLDAPKCDRIRITLRSPLRGTAAIAEVEIP